MNKAELSMLLDQKVREKILDGYSITTYAMDAASRDQLKRGLKPVSHQIDHHDVKADEWQEYLSKVKTGTYQPEKTRVVIDTALTTTPMQEASQGVAVSVGLWKAHRH